MRSHRLRAAVGNSVVDLSSKTLNRHYDFGNSSSYTSYGTTVNDLSGNGHGATWMTSPGWGTSNGGYVILGASTAGVLQADQATFSSSTSKQQALTRLAGTGGFTIELWVNINHSTAPNLMTNTTIYRDDPVDIQFSPSFSFTYYKMNLFIHGTGWGGEGLTGTTNQVSAALQSTQFTTNTYSSTGLQGWQHIVLTRTSTGTGGLKFYINNSLKFTGTNSINYNLSTNVPYGDKDYGAGANITGTYIAIIREYLDGFNSAEVAASFNADRARFGV